MDYLPYLTIFLTLITTHFLAMASPGPTFIMVVQQSLMHGKRTALWTCLGIGFGELFHVIYSLLGIGWIIAQSSIAFTLLKILGATYLIIIGTKSFRKKEIIADTPSANTPAKAAPLSNTKAFGIGFLTNALNPKASLFFLSLFSVIITPETPFALQLICGLWIFMMALIWFTLVALCFSHETAHTISKRFGVWINRITGGILVMLGVKLALTKAH